MERWELAMKAPEDWSLDPQSQGKGLVDTVTACDSTAAKAETGNPWSFIGVLWVR